MTDAWLTVNEAARWFGVQPVTVRSWVARYDVVPCGHRGTAKLYAFRTLCDVESKTRNSHNLRKGRFAQQTPS